MTILVDTSAWVEYLRATRSAADDRLRYLIGESDDVCVTEPVIAELLIGPRDDRGAAAVRKLLRRFVHLPFHSVVDFDGAVRIHRKCQRAGVTPGGLIDCMIANVAKRNQAQLLTFDTGLSRIADVMGIELDPASLR